jgi:hypothetical protein
VLDRLVPKTVRFDPELRSFGNHLVGALLVRALYRVFRSTLQGYKSIGDGANTLFWKDRWLAGKNV